MTDEASSLTRRIRQVERLIFSQNIDETPATECPLAPLERCLTGTISPRCRYCQTLGAMLDAFSHLTDAKIITVIPPSGMDVILADQANASVNEKQDDALTKMEDKTEWLAKLIKSMLTMLEKQLVGETGTVQELSPDGKRLFYATIVLTNFLLEAKETTSPYHEILKTILHDLAEEFTEYLREQLDITDGAKVKA